ncbi:LysR family transcriptional regulator [Mameliella sp. AT18]|uniref:LysR family transcriptional regulator n=1 Tax=Mameliella sp. AT18 TaxID=3028385 RepID=UPI00084106B3|nr:LysR family transcriptional regulator [Mameliella sp. AT18]MDD9729771.1 LysR family transcriptional regulator [Mameliella sp. AT18]ODM46465.1 LysR family transcriptional regulator [Ruegeria sp. PBVC088]
MDLRQIRQFIAVAEELHFGRAAQRLNMTQPPLSMSIRALEESLGVQLFNRTRKSVALTPAGTIWLGHARQVLAEAERLPAIARRAARGELGELRLAFVSIASYGLLPNLVRRFRDAFPDVRVDLREATSDMQFEALAHGDIDAGIIIRPGEAFRPSLSHHPLPSEPLVAVVPDRWAPPDAIAAGSISFDRIADAPLIFFPRHVAPAYYDAVADHYAAHGRALRIHQEAIQMQTIIGLVAAGLGISLVPRSMTEMSRKGAHYLNLEGTPPRIEVCMIWKDGHDQPVLKSFLSLLDSPDH